MRQLSQQDDPGGASIMERWHGVWRVVFPDVPLPSSPYRSGREALIARMLCTFLEGEGKDMVRDFLKDRSVECQEDAMPAVIFSVVGRVLDEFVDVDDKGTGMGN